MVPNHEEFFWFADGIWSGNLKTLTPSSRSPTMDQARDYPMDHLYMYEPPQKEDKIIK